MPLKSRLGNGARLGRLERRVAAELRHEVDVSTGGDRHVPLEASRHVTRPEAIPGVATTARNKSVDRTGIPATPGIKSRNPFSMATAVGSRPHPLIGSRWARGGSG